MPRPQENPAPSRVPSRSAALAQSTLRTAANRERMDRVIPQLLSNAIKFRVKSPALHWLETRLPLHRWRV